MRHWRPSEKVKVQRDARSWRRVFGLAGVFDLGSVVDDGKAAASRRTPRGLRFADCRVDGRVERVVDMEVSIRD
ncbi:MAG TPA: hypothetical protein VOA78_01310, partial [Candidatus Dormibacteraeota bacterium]|nr:hypothetical protein [Candidatus Dormibacteraeota bacterium]